MLQDARVVVLPIASPTAKGAVFLFFAVAKTPKKRTLIDDLLFDGALTNYGPGSP